jgi:DNA-binding transcriptional LysR family regulator
VPSAVAALRRRADVDVTLAEAEPPEALGLLQRGEVDLALVFGYEEAAGLGAGLRYRPVGTEPVHLVVAAGSRHATGTVRLGDLAEEPWIVGCVRCRAHLLELCRRAGFNPVEQHTTDDYVVRQSLVAAGLGVTLLPEAALTAYRHPEVVLRRDRSFGRRAIGIVHRDGADLVPGCAALIQELGSRVRPAHGGSG